MTAFVESSRDFEASFDERARLTPQVEGAILRRVAREHAERIAELEEGASSSRPAPLPAAISTA